MEHAARSANKNDVAGLGGVTVSSVPRVLADDHSDVSVFMRERVLAAATVAGYRPDRRAQSLRSGRSKSIGFVVGDISNPLITEFSPAEERRFSSALRSGDCNAPVALLDRRKPGTEFDVEQLGHHRADL